ncbi:SMI1/KNR4 family protein [Polaromonas aquatica]|uniref:SMI1/KNR4 family protein n=1 Tax=Polaromonas aquatica TaxID=332657 RepID=UPI003D660B2A
MRDLVERLLSARRKAWFRSRPVFEGCAAASDAEVAAIEAQVGRRLSEDMRIWLVTAGFGDIDGTLSIRREWFQLVEEGELKGGFRFAQDELGNFYACAPDGHRVVFFSRSEPAYAVIAPSFCSFVEELERRDYKVIEWMASMKLAPYSWDAI